MTDTLLTRHRRVMPRWQSLYYDQPLHLVQGSGRHVTDAKGTVYLDFFAGILTNMLGYDVPEVAAAIRRQVDTGIVHTSTLYLIESQVELAERIAGLSGIPDARVFFTNSGTEANEAALMLATQARRSNQVLALRNSYHGRSFATVGVTGNRSWSASSLSPLSVTYLHGTTRPPGIQSSMSDDEYVAWCSADLQETLATSTAGEVACLIAEPIQGVGGFTAPPAGLFARYQQILEEHGILLISDEVQTGWGRTGDSFWGMQSHDVVPDAMTFAKGLGNGLAIGGVVARAELMDCLQANSISTFGGNPLSTAAALATLNYVIEHDLQGNAHKLGTRLLDGLREVAQRLPGIDDVRGRGLMIGIELVDPESRVPTPAMAAAVMEGARRRGLLIGRGGLHGNVLRLAPPMTLTPEECEQGLAALTDALEEVLA